MNLVFLVSIIATAYGQSIDLERVRIPKEAPNYRIIGGTPEYEIREYEEGICTCASAVLMTTKHMRLE